MNYRGTFSKQDLKRKNHLKRRRLLLNMTQQDVADKAKVSVRTYQAYEQDLREPSVFVAIRIANVLRSNCESLWDALEAHDLRSKRF